MTMAETVTPWDPREVRVLRAPALGLAFALLAAVPAFGVGWTQPIAITPAAPTATVQPSNAQTVLNKSGAQAIAWDDFDISGDSPVCIGGEATTRVPGGAWAAPFQTGCSAKVQIGPDGTAVVVWEQSTDTGSILQASTAQAGTTFGSPQAVDTSDGSHNPIVVALDSQGIVTAAWIEYDPIS